MHSASIVLALLAALQADGYEFSRIFSRFASTGSDSDISAVIVLCTQSISYRGMKCLINLSVHKVYQRYVLLIGFKNNLCCKSVCYLLYTL